MKREREKGRKGGGQKGRGGNEGERGGKRNVENGKDEISPLPTPTHFPQPASPLAPQASHR